MEENKTIEDLPEGWKRVKLGEVANVQGGFAFKSSDFINEGIQLVKIANIYNGIVNLGSEKTFLPQDYLKKYPNFILKTGDVIIALSGATIGKVGIIKDNIIALLNQRIGRFLNKKDHLIRIFLYYVLLLPEFTNFILSEFVSSAQPNISPLNIEKFLLRLPPLSEQQKIAEILETVDNAIESTDKIIEKYKRIKQGLIQELLTKGIDEKGNIRSEETHKFKNSPIGRIPEEWELKRLGDIGEIIYGERLSNYENKDYGESLVYGTMGILAKTDKFIGVGESIILPRKGSINNKFYIPKDQKFFVIDTAFFMKFNKVQVNAKYIFYLITQIDFTIYNEATGVPSLSREVLNKIILPLPSLSEQQRITEILSQIDNTIEKEQKYKEKLQRLKQGLMEDLLTGKVRVNNLITTN